MMQGDSRSLVIEILNSDKKPVTPDAVTDVEIVVGSLKKRYKNEEVSFDTDSNKWLFPLTQEETFKMPASHVKAQVRVVWADGTVEGASLGCINVGESISKEVL